MVDNKKCFAFQVIIITILESQIANHAHEDQQSRVSLDPVMQLPQLVKVIMYNHNMLGCDCQLCA